MRAPRTADALEAVGVFLLIVIHTPQDMSTTIEATNTLVAARAATSARAAEQVWPLYAVLFSSV